MARLQQRDTGTDDTPVPRKGTSLLIRIIVWAVVLGAIFAAYQIYPDWFRQLGTTLHLH